MFGLIPDDEFNKQLEELSGSGTRQPRASVVSINRGRTTGAKEVPIEIKKIIAEEAISGTPARELSELFEVSESSISAYKKDATSTASYDKPNAELKNANDIVRDNIVGSARSKLLAALDSITPEKLSEVKVRDAAGIAKDMSAIIKNMEPEKKEGSTLNQQFVFYAPNAKKESDFETVESRD